MKVFLYLLLLSTFAATAQGGAVSVEGRIKNPYKVTVKELSHMQVHILDSLTILNHKLEYRSTLKNIQGVLLKEVLAKAEFDVSSPKELSEFYIVCVAADGYKVVYSWNELFNSETGYHTLIAPGVNGASAPDTKEGLAVLTPTDRATGRRYVKNLANIIIARTE